MVSKRVLVVAGGLSNERDVSLKTGKFLYESIKKIFKLVDLYDFTSVENLLKKIKRFKPTVIVNGLHGGFGENGGFQAMLDALQIPYTGSGHATSAICMDKCRSSLLAKASGVEIPESCLLPHDDKSLPYPVIVKPNREGSSIGVSLVQSQKFLRKAIREASQYDEEVLLQRFIPGVEVTVPVIFGRSLTPIEIKPKRKFYDYVAKYTKGMTEFRIPASLTENQTRRVKIFSEKLAVFFNVRQYCRIDYIFLDDKFYFLELNTLPGFTETSLVPKALMHDGYDVLDFLKELIMTASFGG